MQIHTDIHQLPHFANAVITIGTFDGIHSGHRQVIKLLQSEAAAVKGETVVITFHPHPKMIIEGSGQPIRILTTLEEKINLFEKIKIDHLVIVAFNHAFAEQSADQYIKNFLIDNFHPHTIIIGHDHRFGKNREGDYRLLEEKASVNNYTVKEIPEYIVQNIVISSTKIRQALLHTDIDTAATLLGYPYFFTGKVVHGNKLGRTLGYPTANLVIEDEDKLIPGNAVYAVTVEIVDSSLPARSFKGMMNIGFRPTVEGKNRIIEVHVFDFDEILYERKLTVTIQKKLRNEVKFTSLEALKEQLGKDKKKALATLL